MTEYYFGEPIRAQDVCGRAEALKWHGRGRGRRHEFIMEAVGVVHAPVRCVRAQVGPDSALTEVEFGSRVYFIEPENMWILVQRNEQEYAGEIATTLPAQHLDRRASECRVQNCTYISLQLGNLVYWSQSRRWWMECVPPTSHVTLAYLPLCSEKEKWDPGPERGAASAIQGDPPTSADIRGFVTNVGI